MIWILRLMCFIILSDIHAQQPGEIRNGGFEASFRTTFVMPGWTERGNGSTPDIQPGQWQVALPPLEGNTYLGLINREDGTREAVSQKLSTPLKSGRCYYFSVALARDPVYAGFNLPLSLQVKGKTSTGRIVPLARSPLVSHSSWKIYTLEFTSDADITELILEGAPGPGVLVHYRGNILVDAMSGISACIRASL